jgi:WD40 repeat protein
MLRGFASSPGGQTMGFTLLRELRNHGAQSLLPEVAFSPDGATFAVSVQEQNEVRLHDTASGACLRTWSNPEAGFGEPHGLVLTARHLLVSNRHYFSAPSDIRTYRLDAADDHPVDCLTTPFPGLVEAHSLALSRGRLLVTYCEGDGRTGGVVCYGYDDSTGKLGKPLSVVEDCFRTLGDPKGVSFLDGGRRAVVSFNSLKTNPVLQALCLRYLRRWYRNRDRTAASILEHAAGVLRGRPVNHRKPLPILENGLAFFTIDEAGRLGPAPERVLLRDAFCRLENVHCQGNICAVADTINGQVQLYDLAADPDLCHPEQVIREGVTLPHGVKVSPDGRTLVVSNYGLRTWRQEILWSGWSNPRRDTISIYTRP